jgi:hypothetical protein
MDETARLTSDEELARKAAARIDSWGSYTALVRDTSVPYA